MNLSGTLFFRERLLSEKIVCLDLSNGSVKELFDGFGVSLNTKGDCAYVNTAQKIIVADAAGKTIQSIDRPASSLPDNTVSGSGSTEPVISPDGNYLAVAGITRRVTHTDGGISIDGQPLSSVVILDRKGNEIASFVSASYPTWTPAGKLMMADPDKPGIFITGRPFKNLQPISNIPGGRIEGICISPDEKTIAFSLNNRIWTMNVNGSGLKQLTELGLDEVTPVFSPDGTYLAFQQSIPNKKEFFQVLILRLSDQKIHVVTDNSGANREPLGRMYWLAK